MLIIAISAPVSIALFASPAALLSVLFFSFPDFLGHPERRPCLGPSRVEGRVSKNLGDFFFRYAVFPGAHQVILKGRVHQPLRHQRRHRHDGTVAQGQLVLGLRHITDWMLYVYTYLTDAFWAKSFLPAAQALGLDVFAQVLTKMCQRHLGLSESIRWCQQANAELCDQLMDYVLEQGNFGSKQTDVGSKVTRLLGMHKGIGERLRLLQISGLNHWSVVKRYPFFKPFAWIYGGCRYARLTFGRKNALGLFQKEKRKSEQQEEMYEGLGLSWNRCKVILRDDQFIEQRY